MKYCVFKPNKESIESFFSGITFEPAYVSIIFILYDSDDQVRFFIKILLLIVKIVSC